MKIEVKEIRFSAENAERLGEQVQEGCCTTGGCESPVMPKR